jgi:catechol 2,3-dioxygenase-like lactoylglutathione lyase family enzyme
MAARLHALTVRASDPDRLSRFWADLLGWSREGLELVPDADAGVPFVLAFEPGEARGPLLNQIHFHLTSDATPQEETVRRALELGATHLDVGQLPEEEHVVLADPDANEFCVIEAGNNWLAGTGFLGEVGCDGTREVGLFWSEALGWPLVHDENGETAIQPPTGGVKVAWGGPPLNERADRNRMYFLLVADDLETEVDRLVSLGASVVERTDGAVEMTDPDGNEFWVRTT